MSRLLTAAMSLTATIAMADGHAALTGYALVGEGAALAVMPSLAQPTEIVTRDLATPLRAIAHRPVTGELLGVADGAIFAIDPETGAMTDLTAAFAEGTEIAPGAAVALDFNNAIDAVRAVSSAGDNLVYFPEGFGGGDDRAGSVRRFTGLAYAEGDASAGTEPRVFANAYTNAIAGRTASGTFQYALDARANALISLANNAGTLETVGLVTVDGAPMDLLPLGGFDIVSPAEGQDLAYAILQRDGDDTAGLYAMDLATGAATLLSGLPVGGVTGFAVSLP